MKKSAMLLPILGVFLFSCSPQIRLRIPRSKLERPAVTLEKIADLRPPNERLGYKIFYVSSISDSDYTRGFLPTFEKGLKKGLAKYFELHTDSSVEFLRMRVEVLHFYGEHSRSLRSVLLEKLAWGLLQTPRLITNFLPYNHFAGRVTIGFTIETPAGSIISDSLDVKVVKNIGFYRRGSWGTAAILSNAAQKELGRTLEEMVTKINTGVLASFQDNRRKR